MYHMNKLIIFFIKIYVHHKYVLDINSEIILYNS